MCSMCTYVMQLISELNICFKTFEFLCFSSISQNISTKITKLYIHCISHVTVHNLFLFTFKDDISETTQSPTQMVSFDE